MPLNRATANAGTSARHSMAMPRVRALETERSEPSREPAELADLRARLDGALEEVAFLTEQLWSARAWSAHLLETLRARHRLGRDILVRDLVSAIEGFDRHSRLRDVAAEKEPAPIRPAFAVQESDSP